MTTDAVEGHRLVSAQEVGDAPHYMLRVTDESMWPRFHSGDYALVRVESDAMDGERVIISVGDQTVMRRYQREGKTIILTSDNAAAGFPPIVAPVSQCKVYGVVVGVSGEAR